MKLCKVDWVFIFSPALEIGMLELPGIPATDCGLSASAL
jgi:hypothetical protein